MTGRAVDHRPLTFQPLDVGQEPSVDRVHHGRHPPGYQFRGLRIAGPFADNVTVEASTSAAMAARARPRLSVGAGIGEVGRDCARVGAFPGRTKSTTGMITMAAKATRTSAVTRVIGILQLIGMESELESREARPLAGTKS
ncbi:MAG: hypothetical protein SGI90_01455 [Candidatus Eisenbacteria bacterium]|nr:hypothetical protein [Candidatus Eisenbacteria bacterium]